MGIHGDILEELYSQLNADLIKSDDYPLKIVAVSRFDQNMLTSREYSTPMVMIVSGQAVEQLRDGISVRHTQEIALRGFLRSKADKDLMTDITKMEAALYQWLDQDLDLGDGFRDLFPIGTAFIRYDDDQKKGDVTIRCRLIFVTSTSAY